MGDNPKIALGLRIVTVAYATQLGQLTAAARIDLLRDTLHFGHDDPIIRAGVLDFLALSYGDGVRAAARLFQLVNDMGLAEVIHQKSRVGNALDTISAEMDPAANPAFAWQDRVDICG